MLQKAEIEATIQANKDHQYALKVYTERLEDELKAVDKLISAVDAVEEPDVVDEYSNVVVNGTVKPASVLLPSALLLEDSPFYEDARWKKRYEDFTVINPVRMKDQEVLTNAVRMENQRLFVLAAHARGQPVANLNSFPPGYFERNREGIDWKRVAMKVAAAIPSGAKRGTKECEIRWLGHLHPDFNQDVWTPEEVERLREIIDKDSGERIDWVDIAKKLGTNRTPIDCMRHGITRRVHVWTPEADEKLLAAIELYGMNNWQLVAMNVSEDVTSHQCQKRFHDTLEPTIRSGKWSPEEDERLLRAVAAFTGKTVAELTSTSNSNSSSNNIPWQDVALFVPGRNNNQCREHYQDRLQPAGKGIKAQWTEEEDSKLVEAVKELGSTRWRGIAGRVGNGRTDVMCHRRYDTLLKQASKSSTPAIRNADNSNLDQKSDESFSTSSIEKQPAAKSKKIIKPRPVYRGKAADEAEKTIPTTTSVRLKHSYKGKGKAVDIHRNDTPEHVSLDLSDDANLEPSVGKPRARSRPRKRAVDNGGLRVKGSGNVPDATTSAGSTKSGVNLLDAGDRPAAPVIRRVILRVTRKPTDIDGSDMLSSTAGPSALNKVNRGTIAAEVTDNHQEHSLEQPAKKRKAASRTETSTASSRVSAKKKKKLTLRINVTNPQPRLPDKETLTVAAKRSAAKAKFTTGSAPSRKSTRQALVPQSQPAGIEHARTSEKGSGEEFEPGEPNEQAPESPLSPLGSLSPITDSEVEL